MPDLPMPVELARQARLDAVGERMFMVALDLPRATTKDVLAPVVVELRDLLTEVTALWEDA